MWLGVVTKGTDSEGGELCYRMAAVRAQGGPAGPNRRQGRQRSEPPEQRRSRGEASGADLARNNRQPSGGNGDTSYGPVVNLCRRGTSLARAEG